MPERPGLASDQEATDVGCPLLQHAPAVQLSEASALAHRVRQLYHELEIAHEGSPWAVKDDVLGLVNDVGAVARLVMAAEGRWSPGGDVPEQLQGKLAECLWWILVLAERLDVDITEAYAKTLGGIETHLESSVARLPTD